MKKGLFVSWLCVVAGFAVGAGVMAYGLYRLIDRKIP